MLKHVCMTAACRSLQTFSCRNKIINAFTSQSADHICIDTGKWAAQRCLKTHTHNCIQHTKKNSTKKKKCINFYIHFLTCVISSPASAASIRPFLNSNYMHIISRMQRGTLSLTHSHIFHSMIVVFAAVLCLIFARFSQLDPLSAVTRCECEPDNTDRHIALAYGPHASSHDNDAVGWNYEFNCIRFGKTPKRSNIIYHKIHRICTYFSLCMQSSILTARMQTANRRSVEGRFRLHKRAKE